MQAFRPGRATSELACRSLRGGVERVAEIAAAWRELGKGGAASAPFFQPEWIEAYLRAFEPGATLRIVVAEREGRLAGVLPLVEELRFVDGLPLRRLRGAAGVHSARFDLVAPGRPGAWDEEALFAIWSHLRGEGGWDVLEARDVPEGGAFERLQRFAEADGFYVGAWEAMRTPWFSLPRDGEALLGSLDSKFRANLRRRMRRLRERGEVRLRRWENADPEAIERFYRLEESGWKGARGSAIACSEETRAFYDAAARWAASRGIFVLYALELDGEPVAMHWGLQHGDTYYLPKPAFDERLSTCSPGQLLLWEVAEDLIARGVERFDFLGPWMDWKGEWTRKVQTHSFLYVYRPGLRGWLAHALKFRVRPLLGRR